MLYTIKPFQKISEKIKKEPDNKQFYNALYCLAKDESDFDTKMMFCAELKNLCNQGLGVITDAAMCDFLRGVWKETLLLEAQNMRFDSYMQYIELNREPSKRFWMPRREQLLPVCNAIQDLIDDKLDILTISLPPGTGKSTLEIFLHSMMIGHNPDSPSLASGHSGMLTNSIYEGVLGIINDEEYLWHDVYPNIRAVITNSREQTIDLNKKHRFSSLTCRAIGASLTGATRCEQLLTADDLVSGIEEAMSVERLEKLWTAYTNDLKSRKKLGCKELHLATRWSVHDPIGRLQGMYAEDERCKFIVMPAVDENGESNFNYQYGVGFDRKYFEDMQSNLDEASYRALFMNQPIERSGLLYHTDELRRYFDLPDSSPDAVISVCDTKDKGIDYCVHIVGYVYGSDYYIEDVICDNSPPGIVEGKIINQMIKYNIQMSRFESNSSGGRIADKIRDEVKAKGGITSINTKYTTGNKETRIVTSSPWVKEHCLFKDKSQFAMTSDYGKFMTMLCSYAMNGKNNHDDAPDAIAMFSDFAQNLTGYKVEVFKRPF